MAANEPLLCRAAMIEPGQCDETLLADIAAHGRMDDPCMHAWWLGQSGFLVRHAGRVFLFDPYLSDSLTQKYAGTDKPHVRLTARCVEPGRLPRPEFVTASHVHTDHLDGDTLGPLARAHPGLEIVLPWPVLDEARRRLAGEAVRFLPLAAGTRLEGEGWSLEGVAAAHNDLATDAQGRHHYLGFILRCGPFTLYHSGDTLWHDGLVPVLRPLACDLMLLPINGNRPERRVAGNLNGTEAAALARACAARCVVPCHYDMFAFNTESPDEFERACERLGQPHCVLRCGARLTLAPRVRA